MKKIKRKHFEAELEKLQAELSHLQEWVKRTGERIILVFEGRDAAGKGGVIKQITERVSPRVFRVVALPAPTESEQSQLYIQRYLEHFPAAGEVVLFDRSWYNRLGVEKVMGFCSDDQYERFLANCPQIEQYIVADGIRLLKYFFDVSPDVQEKRLRSRMTDPRKYWKLSPLDYRSWDKWHEYTEAYSTMIEATDTDYAPWYRVPADDKRSARLNCISHILENIPYEVYPFEPAPLEPRNLSDKDKHVLPFRHTVEQRYK